MPVAESLDAPRKQLSVWDAASIIVGIVVGAGIFRTTPDIAQNVPNLAWLAGVWLVGGAMALVGALSYAELSTTYPEDGGEYVYLSRAFGRRLALVYAWAQLWIIRPGSIGFVAYIFAEYAAALAFQPDDPGMLVVYASLPVVAFTVLNMLGVRQGKSTQNVLTAVKVAGLLALFAVALFADPASPATTIAADPKAKPNLALALVWVMLTYGGWNDLSLVAAEVRQPKKNLLRALVLGTAGVTLIYLLVNFAFIHVMGLEGLRASKVPAADALRAALGDDWLGRGAGRAISLLICIACLGAINGMVFTGARVFYATGREHPLFAYAARFNPRSGSPVHALALQGLVTLAAIIGFGISGRGFENMIVFSAPVFWLFFLMVGVSLFVLRRRDPNAPRPYRVVGYPVTPLLFCLSSLLMLYSSLDYALKHASTAAYWAVALLVVGFAVAYWPRPRA